MGTGLIYPPEWQPFIDLAIWICALVIGITMIPREPPDWW